MLVGLQRKHSKHWRTVVTVDFEKAPRGMKLLLELTQLESHFTELRVVCQEAPFKVLANWALESGWKFLD